jgi:hypothetical protein
MWCVVNRWRSIVANTLSNGFGSVSGQGGAKTLRERAAAFYAVIAHASESGIEDAIARFGGALSEADKLTLRSLKPDEVETLSGLQRKSFRAGSCSGE